MSASSACRRVWKAVPIFCLLLFGMLIFAAPAPAVTPSIWGTVIEDGSGVPLEGIQVEVFYWYEDEWDGWWETAYSTDTDASGVYMVYGLPARAYKVSFTDPSGRHVAEYLNDKPDVFSADSVNSYPAATNAALTPAFPSLAGIVTEEGTGDPVGTVQVTIYRLWDYGSGPEWEIFAYTYTNPDGTYEVWNLGTGEWKVFFDDYSMTRVSEYYNDKADLETADWVPTTEGETTPGIDAALTPLEPSIVGIVTETGTGTPLDDVAVDAYAWWDAGGGDGWWESVSSTYTLWDGSYELWWLGTGQYKLRFFDATGVHAAEYFDNKADAYLADWVYTTDGGSISVDADLGSAGSVSGTVTDADTSGPLAGAWATAWRQEGGEWAEVWAAEADPDGNYVIHGLGAGDYKISFSLTYYTTEFYDDQPDVGSGTTVSVAAGVDTPDIDAALAPKAPGIMGTVTDEETGEPIEGAEAVVYRWYEDPVDGGWWQYAGGDYTDPLGEYAVVGLPSGTYRIGFEVGGYSSEYYNDKPDIDSADPVDVSEGGLPVVADAALAPIPPLISGTVTDEAFGEPLEGITVEAIYWYEDPPPGYWQLAAIAETGPDGGYEFRGIPAFDYKMYFWDDAGFYLDEYYDDKTDLELADWVYTTEGSNTTVDVTLSSSGGLSGRITEDGTGDPAVEALASVYQWMSDGTGGGEWGRITGSFVDENGYYTVDGLRTGQYKVKFESETGQYVPEYYDNKADIDSADIVEVTAGMVTENIDGALAQTPPSIVGTVTDEDTGEPIGNVQVAVYYYFDAPPVAPKAGEPIEPGGWWEPVAQTNTAPDGTYEVWGLGTGQFRMGFFEYAGAHESEFYNNKPDILSGDPVSTVFGTTTTIDVALAPLPVSITGMVTEEGSGRPLEGIEVVAYYLYDSGGGGSWWEPYKGAHTDGDGVYELYGLPVDDYRLRFLDPYGNHVTEYYNDKLDPELADLVSVTAYGEAITGVDAVLAEFPPSITGTVTDEATGDPISYVNVAAYAWYEDEWDGYWEWVDEDYTGTDGTYELRWLPPGQYKVSFYPLGGRYATEYYNDKSDLYAADWVDVAYGLTTKNIDAALVPLPLSITGTVTDEDSGEPIEDVDVSFYDWIDNGDGTGSWDYRISVPTGSDGVYEVYGLETTKYRVRFADYSGRHANEFYDNKPDFDTADEISVTYGETLYDVNAALTPLPPSISGTVTKEDTGEPVSYAEVVLWHWVEDMPGEGWWEEIGYVYTAEDGTYAAYGLGEGQYKIEFRSGSYRYASEFYNDKPDVDTADWVDVAYGSTAANIDAALAPVPPSIAGVVTEEGTGEPLSDIGVTALYWYVPDGGDGWWEWATDASTEADGSYGMWGLGTGQYKLEFTDWMSSYHLPEYYNDKRDIDTADWVPTEEGATTTADAELSITGVISGRITDDETGDPLPWAGATAWRFDGSAWVEASWGFADFDGDYTIYGLATGEYRVSFDEMNHESEYFDDQPNAGSATFVSVTQGVVTGGIDAALAKAVPAITGTVTEEGTGAPIEGINVGAYVWFTDEWDESWWEEVSWCQTAEDGTYGLCHLEPGEYKVKYYDWSDRYLTECWDNKANLDVGDYVTVPAVGAATGIDAALALAQPCITGSVTAEDTGGPLEGTNVGAYVWFEEWWGGWWESAKWTTTAADGTYSLNGLEPGYYKVEFTESSGKYAAESWNAAPDLDEGDWVHVVAGDVATGVDASLTRLPTSITGTVAEEFPGMPIENVEVIALRWIEEEGGGGWWAWIANGFTAADGTYEICGLDPGDYKIEFWDEDGRYAGEYYNDKADIDSADLVTVVSGEVTADINAWLADATGAIRGTVRNTADEPLEGISVYSYWFDGLTWSMRGGVSTYADGTYVLPVFGDAGPGSLLSALGAVVETKDVKVRFTDYPTNFYATEWYDDVTDVDEATMLTVGQTDILWGIDAVLSGRARPVAMDDVYKTDEDVATTILGPGVLDNDGDPDSDVLTAVLVTDVAHGALVLSPDGGFMYSPDAEWSGTDTFTYMVFDGRNYSNVVSVEIGVAEVNEPPVLGAIGPKSVNEGSLLTFTATATDADDFPPNTLEFSLGAGAPSGASIDPVSGEFTWTPTEAQGPGSYPVTVIVSDGIDADSETITVTVDKVNDAPVLGAIGNKSVDEEAELAFTATATDADVPVDTLEFSLSEGAPENASIDPATGEFTWTPTEGQGPDTFSITVNVSDGTATDNETLVVTVNEVNQAPVLAGISDQSVSEGSTLAFTAITTDPDVPFNTLTFSLGAGAPEGASIDAATAAFTWTPSEAQGPGAYSLTVNVSDGRGGTDSETFSVTVAEVNTAPVLASIGAKTVDELATLAFTATADDEDLPAQTLSFSLGAGAPSGAAITAGGSFTWTPSEAQGPGSYPVTVIVSDGTDTDSETFTVTVAEVETEMVPIAGTTRISTAIEIAKKAYPGGAANVVIATAMNWPDALGASALAGALEGPILLTTQSSLPEAVADEIESLEATHVVIVGGEPAVSKYVMQQIDALEGVSVERIGGANRYETANAVAARAIDVLGEDYDGTAFVATGLNFPDALGASPLAAKQGWPIYLTNPAWGSNPTVINAMRGKDVSRAIVLGGTNVVSTTIEGALETAFGPDTERLSGANRYETAIEVATWGVANAELHWDKLALATGQNFPDALAGGVLQGKDSSVMLLTPSTSLYAGVEDVLVENKGTITEVRFLGGLPAISQTVRDQVEDALE